MTRLTYYQPLGVPVRIKGELYDGYTVTLDGDVLSWWNGKRRLIPWLAYGYPTVSLRRGGKTKRITIHRIVAEAFLGPCPPGLEVCHLDGNRSNNVASNLRYDTRKNNLADRENHGTSQRGERNPSAKLTDEQAEDIRRRRKAGERLASIAERYGVRESTISRIANGVRRA